MTYLKTTWVDDDGSGTVGTPFSASAMNNIESFLELLDRSAVVPYLVPAGEKFIVSLNRQALWADSIEIEGEGILEIVGRLVEVI